MKNWLRQKLHNFIFSNEDSIREKNSFAMPSPLSSGRHHSQTLSSENEPLRFTIYNASGGKIVEISHYDNKSDRNHTSLHIINSDEDFGAELGKIAFIELLKKG